MVGTASRSAATVAAIGSLAERLVALVRAAPDPGVVVPHSGDWTIRDVIAHLVDVVSRYSEGGHGDRWAARAADVAALNQAEIDGHASESLPDLLTRLQALVAGLPRGPAVDAAAPVTYTGGVQVLPTELYGLVLGEFAVHGHDLAEALGTRWPIEKAAAAEILTSLAPIMPAWVDPVGARGLTAAFEVRLRGFGSQHWQFTDGALVVSPAQGQPVDVTISADPAALLLTSYRRVPLWRPLLAGKLIAWGRRPMLAFHINSYFRAP
jgi:uncharacterized protein (TIGR03083 family)